MSEERSNTKPAKRRRGDRRDGRWIKAPGLQTVMMYILPKRTECEVYMKDTFDCTNRLAFIEEENRIHPEYRTTLFHGIIAILADEAGSFREQRMTTAELKARYISVYGEGKA